MSNTPEKIVETTEVTAAAPSFAAERAAETPQFTAEVIRTTGDAEVDSRNARDAARMQLEVLGELQGLDSSEAGGHKAGDEIAGTRVADMVPEDVTADVQELIESGTSDYILLRDRNGEIVGYANTEVTPLSDEVPAEGQKRDATLFIWVIGIRENLRGKGAIKVLNEKVMEAALERAQQNGFNIVTVSTEGGRDVEAKFRKHWGMHGVYMDHSPSNSLVEAPYVPPPASASGGIITEDPNDPHSKWLIGRLDQGKTITPEEFVQHTGIVYEGYNEGRSEEYQGVTGEIQEFTRDLISQVLQGRPLRLVDHQERKRIEMKSGEQGAQQVVGPQGFSGWLEKHFPDMHHRFQAIVEKLKGDYD
ncbi:MAG: GNAT family N-acetyltransferase [Candidatus Peribacteraceae bacterium]|jgi:hypothetical protein|nr:GNAT family N-acetyltransferase [Candidatus Peribacteraceae bacterium]